MMHADEPTHAHTHSHTHSHARRIIKKACVNKTPAVLVWDSNLHIFDGMPAKLLRGGDFKVGVQLSSPDVTSVH